MHLHRSCSSICALCQLHGSLQVHAQCMDARNPASLQHLFTHKRARDGCVFCLSRHTMVVLTTNCLHSVCRPTNNCNGPNERYAEEPIDNDLLIGRHLAHFMYPESDAFNVKCRLRIFHSLDMDHLSDYRNKDKPTADRHKCAVQRRDQDELTRDSSGLKRQLTSHWSHK